MDRRSVLAGLVAVPVGIAAAAETAPAHAATVELGICSFNALHSLSTADAQSDVNDLTGRSGIDVIGFQECDGHPTLYSTALPAGWTGAIGTGAANELAVAWRSSQFTKVSQTQYLMHGGIAHNFPNRYVLEVKVTHVGSGASYTFFNTHVNQNIDDAGHPKDNVNADDAIIHLSKLHDLIAADTSTMCFVTGDFNVDSVADARVQDSRFPYVKIGAVATSSWMKYPGDSIPTNGSRRIDYVWIKNTSLSRASWVDNFVLDGLKSDHNPLITKFDVTV